MRSKLLIIHSAKQKVTDQGGKITQEYSLIKGFASVISFREVRFLCADSSYRFDVEEGTVTTLDAEPYVEAIELDQVVTTQ